MLHVIFSTAPFYVCLFWSIILSESFCQSDKAKRMLTIVSMVSTVLYFCHMYFFNKGDNTFFEGMWALCSLSVYPLYYIYICCLTSQAPIGMRSLGFLLPAVLVAACTWGGADTLGIMAHKVVFMLQVVLVGFFGYKRLTKFDRQLQEVYSDSEDFSSRPVRTLLMWFITISLTSCIFNYIGRQLFRNNDWLLIVPSLLFSIMLFAIFFVGYKRQNVIEQLQNDLQEADSTDNESETYSTDIPLDTIANTLRQLMEEKKLFLLPNIKVGDVAQQIGICRTYLSNYLNQEYHMSFSDYINQQRINYAKQLIGNQKQDKINQIATLSGFSSVASFFRNFKKFEGMTPQEWANSKEAQAQ